MFPKLSNKKYMILDLLRLGREMYGLELVRESNGDLARGTVYVTLDRMDGEGLVTSRAEVDPSRSGSPRRLFRITGHGSKVLHAVDAAQAIMGGATSV